VRCCLPRHGTTLTLQSYSNQSDDKHHRSAVPLSRFLGNHCQRFHQPDSAINIARNRHVDRLVCSMSGLDSARICDTIDNHLPTHFPVLKPTNTVLVSPSSNEPVMYHTTRLQTAGIHHCPRLHPEDAEHKILVEMPFSFCALQSGHTW
jgi:hypothetical protein